jgi:hypothetical protein
MQLRSSTKKGKENKSGKASSLHPPALETPQRSLSSNHSEEDQKTPIEQQPNKPVTRMRGKIGPGSRSKEVIKGKVVPAEASPKTSPPARQDRKRKGEKNIEFPSKPNRKTRIMNQLRLNSKALFKPSLKDPQPILIEDDDSPEFSSMEEMEVNVLKGMTVKKEKSKSSENEAAKTPFVTVKKEYPSDSSQQGIQDYGFDPEQDSIGTSPHAGDPCHSLQDIKPEVKADTVGVQGSTKGTKGKEPEVIHSHNMRTRSRALVDHNKFSTEKEMKKMQVEVKTERVDDNQQVHKLKLQVQTLQHHNQELEKLYSRLQKKYQRLQKKHQKTCCFLKEII